MPTMKKHGGNQLTAVFLQETDDRIEDAGIEDAVEISGSDGINGHGPNTSTAMAITRKKAIALS